MPRPLAQWRLLLPDSLPAFRRATAALLDFTASPGGQRVSCPPVASAERAAARMDAREADVGALRLNKGWFGVAAAGSRSREAGGGGARGAVAGRFSWQLAERQYSCAQYALAFQLAVAPEVGEEEVAGLGPEWVRPDTLLALQVGLQGSCAWALNAPQPSPCGRKERFAVRR
jgi:nuclear pore complex protein Nup188